MLDPIYMKNQPAEARHLLETAQLHGIEVDVDLYREVLEKVYTQSPSPPQTVTEESTESTTKKTSNVQPQVGGFTGCSF